MKFHNFVIPQMFVHFSSRFDESGQKCDVYGANQYIGGYVLYKIVCKDYTFERTKHHIVAGNAAFSLYTDYANRMCSTGGTGTYNRICNAIDEIREKL